jgi:hypothetical protein
MIAGEPARSHLEGLDLGQGDDVVVTIIFAAFGTSGVVEINFVLAIHGLDPLGGILVWPIKYF